MTWSACPSNSDITAVSRSRISRCAGVCTSSTRLRPSSGSSGARPARAGAGSDCTASRQPLEHGRGVEVGLAEERLDLAVDVVAQPRHGGELGAVRLLVQADPQPEVVRVHVEFPLDVDDVRGDEQQPSGAGLAGAGRDGTCGQLAGGRREGLVLAEHAGRQEGQQHARPRRR